MSDPMVLPDPQPTSLDMRGGKLGTVHLEWFETGADEFGNALYAICGFQVRLDDHAHWYTNQVDEVTCDDCQLRIKMRDDSDIA